jgi:hypothetical protein
MSKGEHLTVTHLGLLKGAKIDRKKKVMEHIKYEQGLRGSHPDYNDDDQGEHHNQSKITAGYGLPNGISPFKFFKSIIFIRL